MSCWHVMTSKGYNLESSCSGGLPDCSSANWTTKLSRFYRGVGCRQPPSGTTEHYSVVDEVAAEHAEMIYELQSMVRIGNEWASLPETPRNQDPQDPSVGKGPRGVTGELESDATSQKTAAETNASCSLASLDTFNFDEDQRKTSSCLYSTVTKSNTSIDRSQTLAAQYYEELPGIYANDDLQSSANASLRPSTDYRRTGGDVENLEVAEQQGGDAGRRGNTDDGVQAREIASTVEEDIDETYAQLEDIEDTETASESVANQASQVDRGCSNEHHPISSSTERNEQNATKSCSAGRRPTSQLSESLRNNLEKLLQRGPMSSSTASVSSRRRRTKRNEGQFAPAARRQTTGSKDSKLTEHRRYHHHHHHRHHTQHQQLSEQDEHPLEMTDYSSVRTASRASLSAASTISDESIIQVMAYDSLLKSNELSAEDPLQFSPSNVSTYGEDRLAQSGKPVAMVQPRKVHGVRVLPSPTASRRPGSHASIDAAVRPSRLTRSPAIRAPRIAKEDAGIDAPSTQRTGQRSSELGDPKKGSRNQRYPKCLRRPAAQNMDSEEEGTAGNWQCKVSSPTCHWPPVGKLPAVAETGNPGVEDWAQQDQTDTTAHEALLMTKKKDAEIAALLRHIRFNGMSRDPNDGRRRPAFNDCLLERINFERSLGYYP